MLKGKEFGEAIHIAIQRKLDTGGANSKAEIARYFGIKPPSLVDWVKKGSVAKDKLPKLFEYFSDVCEPEHWGLKPSSPMIGAGLQPLPIVTGSVVSSGESDSHEITLMNAYGSMGEGNECQEEDAPVDLIRLKKDWVKEYIRPLTSPKNLYFIHALGDSMMPTLNHGDILLIDAGVKSADIDGVYALRAHKRLFIKRVRQRLDGSHEISSDNPTVKTVDVLNGEHEVEIIGKVVWIWNGRKV